MVRSEATRYTAPHMEPWLVRRGMACAPPHARARQRAAGARLRPRARFTGRPAAQQPGGLRASALRPNESGLRWRPGATVCAWTPRGGLSRRLCDAVQARALSAGGGGRAGPGARALTSRQREGLTGSRRNDSSWPGQVSPAITHPRSPGLHMRWRPSLAYSVPAARGGRRFIWSGRCTL